MKRVGETYWISPMEEGFCLDASKVKKIIEKYKKLNIEAICNENKQDNFYIDLEDEADDLIDNIHKKIKAYYSDIHSENSDNIALSLAMEDYKHDYNSIVYEVTEHITWARQYRFTQADFEAMEEFLTTPRGKELEGWAKWEEYWKKREE